MRRKKSPSGIEDWLEKADADLKRVDARLKDDDLEDAAFHLQQAVEKYLKAYLLSKGWELKKTHDLEVLLDEAIRHDAAFEEYRDLCEEAAGYYLVGRYPLHEKGPSGGEVRSCLKKAKGLARMILRSL